MPLLHFSFLAGGNVGEEGGIDRGMMVRFSNPFPRYSMRNLAVPREEGYANIVKILDADGE